MEWFWDRHHILEKKFQQLSYEKDSLKLKYAEQSILEIDNLFQLNTLNLRIQIDQVFPIGYYLIH